MVTVFISSLVTATLLFALPARAKEETFADAFKPIPVADLYALYDAHPEEHARLNALFAIETRYNVKKAKNKKVLAYSLFWKPPFESLVQPYVNERSIHVASNTVKSQDSFFNIYVKPLIEQLETFQRFFPDWIVRIYLAHDLEFLIPSLARADVEIFTMESNSLAAAPGSLWRFLVFDDPDVKVAYIRDADNAPERLGGAFTHAEKVLSWVDSTKTKGFFRLRDFGFMARHIPYTNRYIPIAAGAFGAKKVPWLNMGKALKGFILHRQLFLDESRHPKDKPFPSHPYGFGNQFPNYGFDERFLKHVIYFEAADRNQLTALWVDEPQDAALIKELPPDHWVTMDLAYTKDKKFP